MTVIQLVKLHCPGVKVLQSGQFIQQLASASPTLVVSLSNCAVEVTCATVSNRDVGHSRYITFLEK